EWVTQAIATDPNLYLLHMTKAWVLILQKRPEEAIVAVERSLALNPSNVSAYIPWSAATTALGHPERAIELIDKAIRLSPREPSSSEPPTSAGAVTACRPRLSAMMRSCRPTSNGPRHSPGLFQRVACANSLPA